jgi:transposase
VAAVGNAREFKSGRELSTWLGLVPRQHSSGGKTVLLGISNRGDRYLRTLFIHGARSAVRTVEKRKDPRSVSISRLKGRQGKRGCGRARQSQCARDVGTAHERSISSFLTLAGPRRNAQLKSTDTRSQTT